MSEIYLVDKRLFKVNKRMPDNTISMNLFKINNKDTSTMFMDLILMIL